MKRERQTTTEKARSRDRDRVTKGSLEIHTLTNVAAIRTKEETDPQRKYRNQTQKKAERRPLPIYKHFFALHLYLY